MAAGQAEECVAEETEQWEDGEEGDRSVADAGEEGEGCVAEEGKRARVAQTYIPEHLVASIAQNPSQRVAHPSDRAVTERGKGIHRCGEGWAKAAKAYFSTPKL